MSERNININCDLHLKSSSRLFTSQFQILSASVHMSFSAHFLNSCFPAPSVNCAQPIYVWGYKMPAGMVAIWQIQWQTLRLKIHKCKITNLAVHWKKTQNSVAQRSLWERCINQSQNWYDSFLLLKQWRQHLKIRGYLSQTPKISLPSLFDMGCESLNSYNTTIPPVVCLKCRRAGSVPVT